MKTIGSAEVLVIDDSPSDAELTIHALKIGEVTPKVTWLFTADEALFYMFRAKQYAHLEPALPHLVLLDVEMPGIGGIGVLERLKLDPRTRCVPIVMLSSRQDDATVRKCYGLGANSYLVRPVAAIEYFRQIVAVANYWLTLNMPLHQDAAVRPPVQLATSSAQYGPKQSHPELESLASKRIAARST